MTKVCMPMDQYICHCLDEWFDQPCGLTLNGTEAADIITKIDLDWCENNCGNVSGSECWLKLFECEQKRWE